MKLQDFRVGLRLLAQDLGYSLVAVLGLGVGLAACLLLLGFARYSWSYDAHVPRADQIYVIKCRNNLQNDIRWLDKAPLGLREASRTIPGVTASTAYLYWFPLTIKVDDRLHRLESLTVLPGFAEMLGVQAIRGDLNEALTRPDSFAITESVAMRLFGTTDVVGRAFHLNTVETSGTARIAAIVRDPPANTTIPFETLNGAQLSLVPDFMRQEALTGEKGWPGFVLIRLHPGTSPDAVNDSLQQLVDKAVLRFNLPPEALAKLAGRKFVDIRISPLRDAYFDKNIATDAHSPAVDRGDARVVAGLVAIAVLILALAALNYVNLATIRVIRRQREIGMRKVLGSGRRRLALQFVAESLLVSLLATVIGMLLAVLAVLALPVFSELVNRDLASVFSLANVAMALGLGLALGLLISIYPVWIAFRVRPSRVLAGRPDTESKSARRLRQSLSVLQVGAAMGLASFTLAVAWQTRFAVDASPGFDPAPLLVFEIHEGRMVGEKPTTRPFLAELSQQPAIAGIAMSTDAIGRSRNPWSAEIKREGGQPLSMDMKEISPSYFEEHGIRPIAGRLFNAQDKESEATLVVLNAIAARQLGFASPEQAVGQTVLFRSPLLPELQAQRIVGIAPEIRFRSLREAPGPVAYHLWPGGVTVTVRAGGSVADAERAVQAVWARHFPQSVLEMIPAKDIYAANYADDARLAKLLAIATLIAMIIAAFGAYVLATDAVQRRTREIALRKLFGARRRDIGRLVAREIGAIVAIAALLGLPLSALAIARYLAPFTERTPVAYWTLGLALFVALAVVTFAAARQTWSAMRLKPAVAMRGVSGS